VSMVRTVELMLLQSESPSGKCAKLHTVAENNNRDHAPRPLYYCLFAPHMCGVVIRAHPIRGESHIHRNANGEVVTSQMKCNIFPKSFLLRAAPRKLKLVPDVFSAILIPGYLDLRFL